MLPMTKAIIILGVSIILFSCRQRVSQQPAALRDIAIERYLSKVDSIPEYDTADFDFRFLRAYKENDTAFMAAYLQLENEWDTYRQTEEYKQDIEYPDSCIHQEQLRETAFEEAYRFKYRQSFCPYRLNVTVGRTGDSAILQFIIYKPTDTYPTDTTACRIVNQFQKAISASQWKQFSYAIEFADFWALKAENGASGLDGNDLEVEGYLNEKYKVPRPAKYHKIHRWSGTPVAIVSAFRMLLLFSENEQGCYVVKQNKQLLSRSSLYGND